jgi:ATP-dependent exoDNAse (exonuclease V) beta subunit
LHEHLADRIDRRRDSEVRVHLLTLFKAKGLEYDTVILPVLDGTTRQDDKQVVAWHEYEGWNGDTRYLLAPIEATGDDSDPIQKLIRQFDREQAGNERDRLLYVATTRAKKNLHLFVELKRNSNGDIATPRKGSLLERLWPVVESECNVFSGVTGTHETSDTWFQPKIRRFDTAWVPPEPPPVLVFARTTTGREPQEVTFDWAGSDAMRIGSVVHRCLQFIVEQNDPAWSDTEAIIRMLREAGVAAAALDASRQKVCSALQTTAASEEGQWALSAHLESACEYPVTVCHNGQTERLIIDRTFVAADGVRWIVDYKTSSHEGGGLDGFLANELERYAGQLVGYCNAMQSLEPDREVRAGLYFPLLGIFSELKR